MCETPLVGSLYKDKVDFRWPLTEDIKLMPVGSFTLEKISFKKRKGGHILGLI